MKSPNRSRRHFLSLASLSAFAGCPNLFAASKSAAFEDDVKFLLKEFEGKAGHFFKLKAIDWKAVETEFTAASKKVKNDVDHVKLCQRLVARLRDGHASLRDVKVKMPDDSSLAFLIRSSPKFEIISSIISS